jgi:hypothetical protein
MHNPDLKEGSKDTYISRIKSVQIATNNRPLEWILTHPIQAIKYMKLLTTNPRTMSNFITAFCTLFKSHPEFFANYKDTHFKTWSHYMMHYSKKGQKEQNERKWTARQKEKAEKITWHDVANKYCEMRKDPNIHRTLKSSLQFLFISSCVQLYAKRADLGNVKIYEIDPKLKDVNYLTMKPPALYMNVHKSDKTLPAQREPLNKYFVEDLKASLKAHPREHLFIGSRSLKPYDKRNSFAHFVVNTFKEITGVGIGVQIWRPLQVVANTDYNNTPYHILEQRAHYRLHKLSTEMKAYVKLPDDKAGRDAMRRPENERGTPVTCDKRDY